MTREEEILRQALLEARANKLAYPMEAVKEGFVKGAEWAGNKTATRLLDNHKRIRI